MLPMYVLMRKIGIANTYLAVIFAHTTLNLPFTVLMMKGFFRDVPLELEQAAQVDGCSRLRTFLKICADRSGPRYHRYYGAAQLLERIYVCTGPDRTGDEDPSGGNFLLCGVGIYRLGRQLRGGHARHAAYLCSGRLYSEYFVRGLTGGAVKDSKDSLLYRRMVCFEQ